MKVLIIYATAGVGHKKAAEAIYDEIKNNRNHEVAIIDSLDYTPRFFKFIYSQGYSFLVRRLPLVWGFFYWLTDFISVKKIIILCRRCCNFANSRRLTKFLLDERPQVIISTHFFANQTISRLKKKNCLSTRLICVITDFTIHSFWFADGVDLYTVANPELKNQLISKGMKQEMIEVAGIPVKPIFLKLQNKDDVRRELGINPDIFTVLIVTGTIGVGPIEKIVKVLKDDVQLLVVCGRNKRLFDKLSRLRSSSVRIFGLVDNLDELMDASNVVVTKAGGLTISESLAKNLPMIFFTWIPGQEIENAKLMKKQGAAFIIKDINRIKNTILRLKDNPQEIENMKKSIKSIAMPGAAQKISSLIK